jgi:hypothetical protein
MTPATRWRPAGIPSALSLRATLGDPGRPFSPSYARLISTASKRFDCPLAEDGPPFQAQSPLRDTDSTRHTMPVRNWPSLAFIMACFSATAPALPYLLHPCSRLGRFREVRRRLF